MNESHRLTAIWSLLSAIIVIGLAFVVRDCAGGHDETHEAEIIDRTYEPERTSTGVGTDSKGRAVVTTHRTSEAWRLIVRDDAGVRALEVNRYVWADARPGARVILRRHLGRSGHCYSEKVVAVARVER